jgi:hypothetical protein
MALAAGMMLLLLPSCKQDRAMSNNAGPASLQAKQAPPLVEWVETARVQAHTRFSLKNFQEDPKTFMEASAIFAEMGIRTYTRHFKTGGEANWWESKDPKVAQLPAALLEDAHKRGIGMIAYYRHMENSAAAAAHPDWLCRQANDSTYERRGAMMCLNSPYKEYLIENVKKVAALGVDGIYFDEVHMPPTACWCQYCKADFAKISPKGHPKGIRGPHREQFMKLKAFNNQVIIDFFKELKAALREAGYQTPIIVSSNNWPAMTDNTMNSELFQYVDIHKTEMKTGNNMEHPQMLFKASDAAEPWPLDRGLKLALGYVLARDATNGAPAHIWVHKLANDQAAMAAVAGMAGHGSIANLDLEEGEIRQKPFQAAFELGNKIGDALGHTRPLRWFGIYFSEEARDSYWNTPNQAWEQVIMPVYGAYACATQLGAPVGMLTDAHLRRNMLSGYKVVFVADRARIPAEAQKALSAFEAQGGTVIESTGAKAWHTKQGQAGAIKWLRQQLEKLSPPTQALYPSAYMATDVFRKNDQEWVFAAINDFGWVYTGNLESLAKRKPEEYQRAMNQQAGKMCQGFQLQIRCEASPKAVTEAVTGVSLPFKWDAGKKVCTVEMPPFQHIALARINW